MHPRHTFLLLIYLFIHACLSGKPGAEDSLLAVWRKKAADTLRVNAAAELAKELSKHDPVRGIVYADSAYLLAKEADFEAGIFRALFNRLECEYLGGRYDDGLETVNLLLAEKQVKNSDKKQSDIFRVKGNILYSKSELALSLAAYIASLEASERTGDSISMGSAYTGIGNVYFLQGNLEKSLESHLKGLAIFEKRNDLKRMSKSINNIGNVYVKLPDFRRADSCYQRSFEIKEKLGDKMGMAMSLNNMISIALNYELDTARAISLALRSLEIRRSISDRNGIAMSLVNLGSLHYNIRDHAKGLEYTLAGLQEAQAIGDAIQTRDAYQILSLIYAARKDFPQAYDYQSRYVKLNDSLLNVENSKQINEMNAKYESEKKDKELLKKDAESRQKSLERNAFIAGFGLMIVLAFFIFRGYRQKQKANIAITQQKDIIEEKSKEITDSIHYARRIQRALLASESLLKKNLRDYFIFYRPRDIVSGDFYWAQSGEHFFIAVADCTGHGVPGAFMSLLSVSALNEAVVEKGISSPDQVLNRVRESIMASLSSEDSMESRDGMDCVLCRFDFQNRRLLFSCANNPLWLLRNGEILEFKADKMPVGRYLEENKPFTLREIALQPGDTVYIFTDGYADQFGGPKGKKFRYSQLKELILSSAALPMEEQHAHFRKTFDGWKGPLEQVDDVLLIGIKV